MIRSVFGLSLQSELDLPMLPPAESSLTPEVVLRFGAFPEAEGSAGSIGAVRYTVSGERTLIGVPSVGRFLLVSGREIVIEPAPGVSDSILRVYIYGLVFTFLLHQRPFLTLHAGAVVSPGGAVVCTGTKGAGKSTTVSGLALRGYPVLCDDIVPVSEAGLVVPGMPRPKLCPDAVRELFGTADETLFPADGAGKCEVEVPFRSEPAPLSALVLLETYSGSGVSVQEVRGAEKLGRINGHVHTIHGLDDPAVSFRRVSSLLSSIPVYRIQRPREGAFFTEVQDKILLIAEKRR